MIDTTEWNTLNWLNFLLRFSICCCHLQGEYIWGWWNHYIDMAVGSAWKGNVPIACPPLHHPLPDTVLLPDELNFHSSWRSCLQRLPKRLDSSFLSRHNPERRSKAPIVCRQSVKIRTADISRCECRNWSGQQSFVSKQGLKELRTQDNPIGVRHRLKEMGKASLSVGACEHRD
jgi:hypothetical protein